MTTVHEETLVRELFTALNDHDLASLSEAQNDKGVVLRRQL